MIQRHPTVTLIQGTGAQPWRARVEEVEEKRFAAKRATTGPMGRPVLPRTGDMLRVILTAEDAPYGFESKVGGEQTGGISLESPKRPRRTGTR